MGSAAAAPSKLAAAEFEQQIDDALREGAELAKAATCMNDSAMVELAFKAYRDSNQALRVKNAPSLSAAFARGMKKTTAFNPSFENCMVTTMLEGRKTMLRGASAAAASLEKSMLPETIGSVGATLGGVMVYAESTVVDRLAGCIEDDSFRKLLSTDYVEIMQQFLSDRGNKVTPDWINYPFERLIGPFKTRVGVHAGHPSCSRQIFGAGMAVELFRQINEAEDDTRGRWLVKRLFGR